MKWIEVLIISQKENIFIHFSYTFVLFSSFLQISIFKNALFINKFPFEFEALHLIGALGDEFVDVVKLPLLAAVQFDLDVLVRGPPVCANQLVDGVDAGGEGALVHGPHLLRQRPR